MLFLLQQQKKAHDQLLHKNTVDIDTVNIKSTAIVYIMFSFIHLHHLERMSCVFSLAEPLVLDGVVATVTVTVVTVI